jgi:hypothetical protein
MMMRHLLVAMFGFAAMGCATTGATLNSGVGDRFPEHPPYYAGTGVAGATIVRLPVQFQRGASQPANLDLPSGGGTTIATLLAEMNQYLDSLATATGMMQAPAVTMGIAPDVYFGCARDATDDCVERGDSALGRKGQTMNLALGRPSPEWIGAAQQRMDSTGATHALVVTLEVGQYWMRQSGLVGSKSVELGTGNTVSLPWMTSLETPVSVLQLTGVLMGRDGRGVKVGAEGFLARRTPFLASALGAQALISPDDVDAARQLRRDDLPGKPLAWKIAMCHLVRGVTGAGATC